MMELVEEVDQWLNPGDVKAPWMLLLYVCSLYVRHPHVWHLSVCVPLLRERMVLAKP